MLAITYFIKSNYASEIFFAALQFIGFGRTGFAFGLAEQSSLRAQKID